uniref:Uncharacterized protein n=1 Tax=Setaria italica TaxID=4555 RepID=K3YP13_SETIT
MAVFNVCMLSFSFKYVLSTFSIFSIIIVLSYLDPLVIIPSFQF